MQDNTRPSKLGLAPSPGLRPSYTFPASGYRGFQYAGANKAQNNVFTGGTQGNPGAYSRYGRQQEGRPQRLSLNPASVLDAQNQPHQNQSQRRHSYGSGGFPSSPLRSPPVPMATRQSFVRHSGEPSSPSSRRGSIQSPTANLDQSWSSAVTSPLASPTHTLKHYSDRLQDRERGVPMQERKVNNKIEKVFTGADAIEWFITALDGVSTVEKAQSTGQQLLKCGLIESANTENGNTFMGSPNSLYKFSPMSKLSHHNEIAQQSTNEATDNQKTKTSRSCVLL